MPGSVSHPGSRDPVRVVVVDDHPALREGLEGLLRQEDGFIPVEALPGADLVVLDYALQGGDGLSLCFQLKQGERPPGVVLYSAYVDELFAVPATLAQADGIVSKTAPVDELLDTLWAVARGERRMPTLLPEAMTAVSSRLPASELPIAGMLFARTPIPEIAETLGVTVPEVRGRALRLIHGLQAADRVPALS